MKKWAKISTIVGSGVLLAGAGAGTVAGIVIPKTLKLKDGLGHFVPGDGESPMRHWNSQKKLNYVALGDSETAGFNGFMQGTPELHGGRDYISYADILANDLNSTGNLNEYHNYAVSGATIPDQQKMFGENQLIHNTIKEADLITVTIGANDLLSFVRLLDMPFKLSLEGLTNTLKGQITDYNAAREAIFGVNGSSPIDGQTESPSAGPTRQEGSEMLKQSIRLLADMVHSGDYSHIINLEKDFKDKVFDLIYRNFMMFIHDLREVAPNAQIIVLGHAMPFAQWPSENVLDKPRDDMGGQTIRQLYQRMITQMRKGATFSLTGENKYTTFLSVDDLIIKKSSDGIADQLDPRDGTNKKFVDYIKYDTYNSDFYVRNAMPNAGDIHPSTFGHQLIGNAVYDFVAAHMGIKDPVSHYSFTKPFDGVYSGNLHEGDEHYWEEVDKQIGFLERLDENPNLSHGMASFMHGLLRNKGYLPQLLGKIIPLLTDIDDYADLEKMLESGIIGRISNAIAKIPRGNMVAKLIRVISDPANSDMYNEFIGYITAIFNSSEKSKPLTKAIKDIFDLFKMNNSSSVLIMRLFGVLFSDQKPMTFKDINEYNLVVGGVSPSRVTAAQITGYIDQLLKTADSISSAFGVTPMDHTGFDAWKVDLINQFNAEKAKLDADAGDADAIKARYEKLRKDYGNEYVTINSKDNPTMDDIFNAHMISTVLQNTEEINRLFGFVQSIFYKN